MTNAGTLSNYDGRYTARGPRFWFKFSYCPSYAFTYGVEHDRIYECHHDAWGDQGDCSRDDVATVRCVPTDQTDANDYTANDYTGKRNLEYTGWLLNRYYNRSVYSLYTERDGFYCLLSRYYIYNSML